MSIFSDYAQEAVSIVYRYNNTPWIGDVHCDASLNEVHTESGEAPEHPVEDGADISDHYRPKPRTVRIEGMITNTPVRVPLSQAEGIDYEDKEFTWESSLAISGIIGLGINAVASATGINSEKGSARGFNTEFDRVGDAWDELTKIVQDKKIIDIVTPLKAYDNMVIESLEATDVNAEKQSGSTVLNSIKFTAFAKQVKVVSTLIVAAPEPTVERAKPTVNTGKKATKELEAGTPARQKSIAKKIVTGTLFQ